MCENWEVIKMDMKSKNIINRLQNGALTSEQVGAYNIYKGARYVPLFDGEWDNSKAYEPLTIVTNQGNSYTSVQYVPVGADINNTTYWALTGNYNSQIESYKEKVDNLEMEIQDLLLSHNYVTPEQYGAKGDGVTDDSGAFQQAVLAAQSTGKGVYLASPKYYLNQFINITSSKVVIFGNPSGEGTCTITANPSLAQVFNVRAPQCAFYYFEIFHDIADGTLMPGIGINFNIPSQYGFNCDGNVIGVIVQGYETGIKLIGKNLNIFDCLISHCAVGIHFFVPETASTVNHRGFVVVNTRFHNCGAEKDYASGTTCILHDTSNSTVLNQFLISGNYADLGTTFFKGQANGGWITNNFLCTLHGDGIILDNPASYNYQGVSIPVIANNFIETISPSYGKIGIHIKYGKRCVIANNFINGFSVNSILCENANICNVLNNILDGAPTDYHIKIINGNNCTISNNNEVYSMTKPQKSVGVLKDNGSKNTCYYTGGVHFGSVDLNINSQVVYEGESNGANATVYLISNMAVVVLGGNTLTSHTSNESDVILQLPIKSCAPLETYNALTNHRVHLSPSGVVFGETNQNEALRGNFIFPYL